ncbi:MAG: beta-mannosidase [Trueperaceae bacterium]
MNKLKLSDWQLKQQGKDNQKSNDYQKTATWLDAKVPGTVHQTLLEAKLIPDPFYGLNEKDIQWVGQSDWLYRTTFQLSQELLSQAHVDLCFDGLDTFAKVELNGQTILESDNMFVPHRVDIKKLAKVGDNELTILFESALRRGREVEQKHGKRPFWNGDSSRLFVRKAQYHYGWDWGPVIMCLGPWKDVYVESYNTRIAEVLTTPKLSSDFAKADLEVTVTLQSNTSQSNTSQDKASEVTLELHAPNGKLLDTVILNSVTGTNHTFKLEQPELWYPNGYGQQPLYQLVVKTNSETKTFKLGFRDIQVIQESVQGEKGSSFYFRVNGIDMFVGGANWIPEDLLLNRMSEARYRERITNAKDANMTMLRVWAGGIYEDDVFYNICDELGLMVWQDFLFACGIYPIHEDFMTSVTKEAEANIKRLRHHACLAVWCGNNEDYAIAESVGQYGEKGDPSTFEARAIYEKLLPDICQRLDAGRFYWPGSPSGGPNSFDQTIGDRHTWDIWHGGMAPYQDYYKFEARFLSEFGMQGYPALATLESVTPEGERFPQSRTVVHHNKAALPDGTPDGHRRIAVYIADNLRDPVTLKGYVYATQFIQGEAMKYAYTCFRRRWCVPGKRAVSGALVWQLNDCWPVSSWALVDSLGVAKPAYYTIKRELEPTVVGLWRTASGCEIWGNTREDKTQTLKLELRAYDFAGKEIAAETRDVTLNPNSSTELGVWQTNNAMVVNAKLRQGNTVVARTSLWSEPFKHYEIPNPGLEAKTLHNTQLQLSVQKPAKGVWLNTASSDNFLDLMPGDPVTVNLKKAEKNLWVQWLGGETNVTL